MKIRQQLAQATAGLAHKNVALSPEERLLLQAAIARAEAALASYEELSSQGATRTSMMSGFGAAAAGVLCDDATGVGVADDPALIFIGLAALATLLVTQPKPSAEALGQAWQEVVRGVQEVALAGERLLTRKINGAKLVGNTRPLAVHLARILGLATVGGMPSGEPPKKDDQTDRHWWKECKAFLKNIASAIKDAKRKQVLRELREDFTEEQALEIERRLAEVAKLMGEDPPTFLPLE